MKTKGPSPTPVEAYVLAAIGHARFEPLEDGTLLGTVSNCPGVVASGADVHECSANLYARLQRWVRRFLENGIMLPTLDGINLNAERARLLQTYAPLPAKREGGEFYEDETALEAAFAEHDKLRPATDRRKSRGIRSSAT